MIEIQESIKSPNDGVEFIVCMFSFQVWERPLHSGLRAHGGLWVLEAIYINSEQ